MDPGIIAAKINSYLLSLPTSNQQFQSTLSNSDGWFSMEEIRHHAFPERAGRNIIAIHDVRTAVHSYSHIFEIDRTDAWVRLRAPIQHLDQQQMQSMYQPFCLVPFAHVPHPPLLTYGIPAMQGGYVPGPGYMFPVQPLFPTQVDCQPAYSPLNAPHHNAWYPFQPPYFGVPSANLPHFQMDIHPATLPPQQPQCAPVGSDLAHNFDRINSRTHGGPSRSQNGRRGRKDKRNFRSNRTQPSHVDTAAQQQSQGTRHQDKVGSTTANRDAERAPLVPSTFGGESSPLLDKVDEVTPKENDCAANAQKTDKGHSVELRAPLQLDPSPDDTANLISESESQLKAQVPVPLGDPSTSRAPAHTKIMSSDQAPRRSLDKNEAEVAIGDSATDMPEAHIDNEESKHVERFEKSVVIRTTGKEFETAETSNQTTKSPFCTPQMDQELAPSIPSSCTASSPCLPVSLDQTQSHGMIAGKTHAEMYSPLTPHPSESQSNACGGFPDLPQNISSTGHSDKHPVDTEDPGADKASGAFDKDSKETKNTGCKHRTRGQRGRGKGPKIQNELQDSKYSPSTKDDGTSGAHSSPTHNQCPNTNRAQGHLEDSNKVLVPSTVPDVKVTSPSLQPKESVVTSDDTHGSAKEMRSKRNEFHKNGMENRREGL